MSSNFFEDVLGNAKDVEEKYIGPDYPYYKYVKTPSEIGMSGEGSLSQMGKDVDGLMNYVQLLVSGGGDASATGKPLGNKFFLKTGAKCKPIKPDTLDTNVQNVIDKMNTVKKPSNPLSVKSKNTDTNTKEQVLPDVTDRYIYIDNVPAGNIPFISQGMGVNFSEFKGLIPGTISNLNAFNPTTMFQAFLAGTTPECQEITMETIDIYNNKSVETHYVTLVDIKNMDPCIFSNKTNPITKEKCKETFTDMNINMDKYKINYTYSLGKTIALTCIGLLFIYLLYRFLIKINK